MHILPFFGLATFVAKALYPGEPVAVALHPVTDGTVVLKIDHGAFRSEYAGPPDQLTRDLVAAFVEKKGLDGAEMLAFGRLLAQLNLSEFAPGTAAHAAVDVEATERLRATELMGMQVLRAAMGLPAPAFSKPAAPTPDPEATGWAATAKRLGELLNERGDTLRARVVSLIESALQRAYADEPDEHEPFDDDDDDNDNDDAGGYRGADYLSGETPEPAATPRASPSGNRAGYWVDASLWERTTADARAWRDHRAAAARPAWVQVTADEWTQVWDSIHGAALGILPRPPAEGLALGANFVAADLVQAVRNLAAWARRAHDDMGIDVPGLRRSLDEARAELAGAREIIARAGLLDAGRVDSAADAMSLQACGADLRKAIVGCFGEGAAHFSALGLAVHWALSDYAAVRAALVYCGQLRPLLGQPPPAAEPVVAELVVRAADEFGALPQGSSHEVFDVAPPPARTQHGRASAASRYLAAVPRPACDECSGRHFPDESCVGADARPAARDLGRGLPPEHPALLGHRFAVKVLVSAGAGFFEATARGPRLALAADDAVAMAADDLASVVRASLDDAEALARRARRGTTNETTTTAKA